MADVTSSIVNFIKERFVGHDVHQSLTTIDRDVSSTPFGDVGSELKAKGSAEVSEFTGYTGKLEKVQVGNFTLWVTDPHLILNFRYTSQTSAQRRTVPGGAIIDRPWASLHPKGSVKATLHVVPQHNAVLRLEIDVDPDHDDPPGHFIRDRVVTKAIGKLDALFEEFTGVSVDT